MAKPNIIKLEIEINGEKRGIYEIKDNKVEDNISVFIKEVSEKYGIKDISKYNYYFNDISLKIDDQTKIYYVIRDGILKIDEKLKKIDEVILNQETSGLWKICEKNLKLFNYDENEWKKFLKKYEKEFIKIFEININEEIAFNILILHYLIKESKGKSRYNLIVKKCINALLKKFKNIDENKIHQFRELIKI